MWACYTAENLSNYTAHSRDCLCQTSIDWHRCLSSNTHMLTSRNGGGQLSSSLTSSQTNRNVFCHIPDELCYILLNKYPKDSGVQDSNQRENLFWGYRKEGRYFSDSSIYLSNWNWTRTWVLVFLTLEKETYFVSIVLSNVGLCWRLKTLWKIFFKMSLVFKYLFSLVLKIIVIENGICNNWGYFNGLWVNFKRVISRLS